MIERKAMEEQISSLFQGGELLRREVRLTSEEYEYFRQTYPAATILPMGEGWYDISWKKA